MGRSSGIYRLAVSALLVFVIGCAAHPLYPGPRRDASEVALLRTYPDALSETSTMIQAVDGTRLTGLQRQASLELLPGEHTIRYAVYTTLGGGSQQHVLYDEDRELRVVTEAGRRYALRSRYYRGPGPNRVVTTLKDTASGRVVAREMWAE